MKGLVALICFALWCALAPAADGDGQELFAVAASRSLLDSLVHKPLSQREPIAEYARGVLMRGTALTSGVVTAEPFPSRDGMGLSLVFRSTTDATSLNSTSPRSDIQVFFNWNIATTAVTRKDIVLRENDFELRPARTEAQSKITIRDVSSQSTGLFWRFKDWAAQRRAWRELVATKAQNEREAAARIASELNQSIDRRAYTELEPLQNLYFRTVYRLLIKSGLLGGRLSMGSSDSWMVVKGIAGPHVQLVDASGFDAKQGPLQARLDAIFPERLAAERVSGLQITDTEIAEAFNLAPQPTESYEGVMPSNDEVLLTLDDKKPLEVTFENDSITATFHARELTTQGQTAHDVALSQTIHLLPGPRLELDPQLVRTRGLPAPLAQYVAKRFDALLRRLPLGIPQIEQLEWRALTARNGVLTVGLALKRRT